MRLYLIRHGQTAWNADQRAQGHTDVPLDETGIRQAECAAGALEGVGIELVLSSDLSRSLETARIIAERARARLESTQLLRERSFGEWEGLSYSEFSKLAAPDQKVAALYDLCPPGGESLADAWTRIAPIAERIRALTEPTAIVGHGGTCSLLLAQLLQGSIDSARSFRFHNCAVTEMSKRHDGFFQLVRFNDSSHLADTLEAQRVATR